MSRDLPEALVVAWNGRTLRVRCPYCLYSHGHAFGSSIESNRATHAQPAWRLNSSSNRRRSDCADSNIGGNYVFVFPYQVRTMPLDYGWEIDGNDVHFITTNRSGQIIVPLNDEQDGRALLPQHKDAFQVENRLEDFDDNVDDNNELLAAMSAVRVEAREPTAERPPPKTDSEIMAELYSDPNFRQKVFFSLCISGNFQELESLCRQYPEDNLIGCVDYEGNTGALLAATEEHGMMIIRWLNDQGCSIGRMNYYGRTPLMEAALWARLETVRYLCQQDIDLEAQDANNMRAIDLADETQRNAKERLVRSGQHYREAADSRRRREVIRATLQSLAPLRPDSTNTEAARQRLSFFNRGSDGRLEIYRPSEWVKPPRGLYGLQLQKAFATLDRGRKYPFVNAMSGYSHSGWPNVLDNTVWTEKAESLRAMLGLPSDKAAACHVESQLLAYLLARHSLYMLEDEDDRQKLASVLPAYDLQPIITVSKSDFCESCAELFVRFKRRFPGWNVTFHFVGETNTTALERA